MPMHSTAASSTPDVQGYPSSGSPGRKLEKHNGQLSCGGPRRCRFADMDIYAGRPGQCASGQHGAIGRRRLHTLVPGKQGSLSECVFVPPEYMYIYMYVCIWFVRGWDSLLRRYCTPQFYTTIFSISKRRQLDEEGVERQ